MSRWRDISTAPKGCMVLCANMKATEARYWAFVGWRHLLTKDGFAATPFNEHFEATHWQPLPEPPEDL